MAASTCFHQGYEMSATRAYGSRLHTLAPFGPSARRSGAARCAGERAARTGALLSGLPRAPWFAMLPVFGIDVSGDR